MRGEALNHRSDQFSAKSSREVQHQRHVQVEGVNSQETVSIIVRELWGRRRSSVWSSVVAAEGPQALLGGAFRAEPVAVASGVEPVEVLQSCSPGDLSSRLCRRQVLCP